MLQVSRDFLHASYIFKKFRSICLSINIIQLTIINIYMLMSDFQFCIKV